MSKCSPSIPVPPEALARVNLVEENPHEMVEASLSIEIHPWDDSDVIFMHLADGVRLHEWLVRVMHSKGEIGPFVVNTKPIMYKEGHVVIVPDFSRALSLDTMIRLTKRIGEKVQQVKQICNALVNF
ncbi:hypothetical protein pETSU_129 [Edwardsiella phage pEt-SU]|uniref:Uncharacterized protein n=1 Tax=Edwardsiella phage pEt-SU TaxID=2562142 RepID=A0A4D6DWJ6_9CAUD|nr:hypothetical protein HOV39_gp129 [Edwardsiella phage pEt-SU]QBZ70710.1 hypothetical protein pETSU_129 [Edwardsiella phage pEt-SU]